MIVGIDASRNRSGGAIAHLVGILEDSDPIAEGISHVHLWAYQSLLDRVPNQPWLSKHTSNELEKNILRQILWQYRQLSREAKTMGVDVMLYTDAGAIGSFHPAVTMSQDMLSYEPGEMARFGVSRAWLRLFILKYVQTRSLKESEGVIFLTRYVANVIQRKTGSLENYRVIPHGVGTPFRNSKRKTIWPSENNEPIRCIYVSNASMYKHQWHVIEAVSALRNAGVNIELLLVGGGRGKAQNLVRKALERHDPDGTFLNQREFVPQSDLPDLIAEAHIYVFASSCENMPITLVEGMAGRLPIACSSRGPMPEVLRNGGVYFDPEDPADIEQALRTLISDPYLRDRLASRAETQSRRYSWKRTGDETWAYLKEIVRKSGC